MLALQTVLFAESDWKIVRQADWETEFNDVYFVDGYNGWAVGSDGVIAHTKDRGETWCPQDSGVEIWLSAVFFASPTDGWAVGENGTILHTSNGGDD